MKPIRILHVVSTMDYGGVETLLMTIYRRIDREQIQFDFLCHNRIEAKYTDEILSLGGRMYMVQGPRHGGIINYMKELKSFFRSHPEYKIVHAHMNRDSAFSLYEAKCARIPVRIAHSHVAGKKTGVTYKLYETIAKAICRKELTHAFACSEDAGKDLYGEDIPFYIVTNGIDVEQFTYDKMKRKECRKALGIENNVRLLGHVGRFDKSKNQQYLINIFEELHQKHPNTKLLLVGDGEKIGMIHTIVKEKGLEKEVLFVGQHRDVSPYYCAMDVFVFPSLFEGLGIVAIEAQTSGLPVIASDTIPREAKITDTMTFVSLKSTYEVWASVIDSAMEGIIHDRKASASITLESPYNIHKTLDFLQDFYLTHWRM